MLPGADIIDGDPQDPGTDADELAEQRKRQERIAATLEYDQV